LVKPLLHFHEKKNMQLLQVHKQQAVSCSAVVYTIILYDISREYFHRAHAILYIVLKVPISHII